MYEGLSGSSYQGVVTQYFDHTGVISGGVGVSAWTDESISAPYGVNDKQIHEEVEYALTQQSWPGAGIENQYVVMPGPTTVYEAGFGAGQFCGYHGYHTGIGSTYTFVPWIGDEPFFAQCRGYSPEYRPQQAVQVVASHEYAESASDPQLNAWLTSDGYEIADICSTAPGDQLPNGSWVNGLWDNYQNQCSLSDSSPPQYHAVANPASNLIGGKATLNGYVNPGGHSTNYEFQWGTTPSYGSHTTAENIGSGTSNVNVSKTISGLHGSTTYHFRVFAVNSQGYEVWSGDESFTTPSWHPTATTEPASEVKAHSAALHATVNPQGFDTHYQFEYGTTKSYGTKVPATAEDVGSGTSNVVVSKPITGLEISTTYHFRVAASNTEGTTNGEDIEFRTPNKPAATSEAPSYTNTLEPQINGIINPEGADTHYQFEYGLTEAYGTKIPLTAEDIGSGTKAVTVSQPLKGLERNKTYHYRIFAENEAGSTHSADKSFTTLPPCKGAESKCVWSTQAPANPVPPSEFELKSVSCSSSTRCLAVGKNLFKKNSFVDLWNGTEWQLLSGTVSGEIRHISCLASGCVAAGVSGGVAETWLIFEFNGSGWLIDPVAPSLPSGSTETLLNGVSCSSETACTAVGSYHSESGYKPLVERWNGSSWSLQTAPNPSEGTAQNAMLSVSCISLGCITVGEAAGKPVAETWFNGSWSLTSSPPLPSGAKGGKLAGVSCSSTSCIAVGDSYETTGNEKTLAETWNGSSWSRATTPNPSEAKGFVNLAGVSCSSSSACTAVGYYASSVSGGVPIELKTLAETWNGSSWSIQSSVNASGQKYNFLMDVSCTSSSACTAAGQDSGGLSQPPTSLAERWNGSSWSLQSVANPQAPIENELKGVSCASSTLCIAAGKNLYAENSFTERWNGTEWMVISSFSGEMRKISCLPTGCVAVGVSGGAAETWLVFEFQGAWLVDPIAPPLPSGSTETVLNGVSCSSEFCTAVGSYRNSEGTYRPLVERWNGSEWSLQSAPNPAEGTAQNAMLSVSCFSSTSCMAAGEAAGKPAAERWNGSEWSLTSPPNPSGAKGAKLAGVSCGSASACMAVGDYYETTGNEKTLAERWNGSSWSIVASPNPSEAKGFVNLTDTSCLSPNSCLAAGYFASNVSGGVPLETKTLAETWNGTEWAIQSTPNATGQKYNALASISCTSSIACTAVGGTTSSLTGRPPAQLAERYE